MQDRYAGDIGDYAKLALLRTLSVDRRLGVAWYRYPDENHNKDGRHTFYLAQPEQWRHLDHDLFDALASIVLKERSVSALERCLGVQVTFAPEAIATSELPPAERSEVRRLWFDRTLDALRSCDIVFADPDNGLVDDGEQHRRQKRFGKRLPLSEARALAAGRPAVIYHHNSRRKGGHDVEVDHWLGQLGDNAFAVRATAYSCRTFFILNPDATIRRRVEAFCHRWRDHKVRLHRRA